MPEQTYAEYCKKQFAALSPSDHGLFYAIISALLDSGWKDDGGNYHTLRYLSCDSAVIKVFRQAESPEVIRICYSAPPEP